MPEGEVDMTTNEVLEALARRKPCALDDRELARWVLELEGRLAEELRMGEEGEKRPRSWPEDGDRELLIPAPYDEVYLLYAQAMAEFTLGEYAAYNNTILLYNEMVKEWRKAWRRGHQTEEPEIRM